MYTKGLANPFEFDEFSTLKLDNARTLCQRGLEEILSQFGPISISYGYICSGVSREIVKYQDPDKPSHHQWNLGAACDFIAHRWVSGEFPTILDLYAPDSTIASPIALAHGIDYQNIPYSRLITYSESPYICLALSHAEVRAQRPRKAFYENRYKGVKGGKPDYRQYATSNARQAALEDLQKNGLPVKWEGAGYPTYHGGGFRQHQHRRVSKYTMLSDWLYDYESVRDGVRNVPSLNKGPVLDAFAAAGLVYDWMIETWEIPRASIVAGYVSHTSQNFAPDNDWRGPVISFQVAVPEGWDPTESMAALAIWAPSGVGFSAEDGFVKATLEVEAVLSNEAFGA